RAKKLQAVASHRRSWPRWSSMRLFDDLVCPLQQRLRDRQSKPLGRFEIDHQLELCRLLDGHVGGLGSLENAIHVGGHTVVDITIVGSVTHESAGFNGIPELGERTRRG